MNFLFSSSQKCCFLLSNQINNKVSKLCTEALSRKQHKNIPSSRKLLIIKTKAEINSQKRTIDLGEFDLKINSIKKFLQQKGFEITEDKSTRKVCLRKPCTNYASIEINYKLEIIKPHFPFCEILIRENTKSSYTSTLQTQVQFQSERSNEITSVRILKGKKQVINSSDGRPLLKPLNELSPAKKKIPSFSASLNFQAGLFEWMNINCGIDDAVLESIKSHIRMRDIINQGNRSVDMLAFVH